MLEVTFSVLFVAALITVNRRIFSVQVFRWPAGIQKLKAQKFSTMSTQFFVVFLLLVPHVFVVKFSDDLQVSKKIITQKGQIRNFVDRKIPD